MFLILRMIFWLLCSISFVSLSFLLVRIFKKTLNDLTYKQISSINNDFQNFNFLKIIEKFKQKVINYFLISFSICFLSLFSSIYMFSFYLKKILIENYFI